ncbi:MAG: hypothetical protein SOX77_06065 [Candidatus Borkfalkiaceae bacterium]|nr:hypothetical protein [Christensenellaceae bacterium]
MNKPLKITLISMISVLCALLLIVLSYVGYVLCSYSRIEDNLKLTPDNSKRGETEPNSEVLLETEYTAVTQNLGFGAYTQNFTFFMDGGEKSRAESKQSVINCITEGAKTVENLAPDFVFFQEIDTYSDRSYHVDERELLYPHFNGFANVFAQNYHSAYLFYPIFEPHGASNSGLITFSRAKINSAIRRSLPISQGLSKFLDLDRCYSVSRVKIGDLKSGDKSSDESDDNSGVTDKNGGKELVLINVHLSAYGGSDEIRAAQMHMLFAEIQSEYEKGNYVVCGGDFNHDFTGSSTQDLNGGEKVDFGWAMPFPDELLKEYAGVIRADKYSGGDLTPTCRNCDVPYKKGNFTIIVDGFLTSANVEVTYLKNVSTDFAYSDHNPVLIKFKLKA